MLLKRIVSAPFRALGRLFRGKANALAAIDFRPGSAALQPEQREKPDSLVRALQGRPRLQLVVSAPYNPQTDALALRDLNNALTANNGTGTGTGRKRYEAMFDKIVATRQPDQGAPQRLAAERAQAIAGYLVQHGVGRERVQTGRIAAVQDKNAGSVSAQLQVAAGR